MAAYSSQQITFGIAWIDTVLAAFKTGTGTTPLVNSAKCRLNVSPSFLPTPGQVISGYTPNEANFSGYSSGGDAVTLSAGVNLSPTCEGVVATVTFISTAASPYVPNTCYGYWMDDGTNVILAEAFPAPGVPFTAAGDFLSLLIQIPFQAIQLTQ
jgi:hypothetical protein